jgi:uncharacterized alkaline shock family protein YloU
MVAEQSKTNAGTEASTAARAAAGTPRVDRGTGGASTSVAETTAGQTTIADAVVAKIVGIAAREVSGVHALGGGGARALGAIRDAVNATDLTQGIKVEVGETQVAADITIVVEYPSPIQQVAENVRSAVTAAITQLVGLEVVEVNIDVNDVHLPADDSAEESEPRVS